MSRLNGLGPFNKGKKTGREIGLCTNSSLVDVKKFGKGLGLKKHSTGIGIGYGKRLKYHLITNDKTNSYENCISNR
jgi:hypothetical protein